MVHLGMELYAERVFPADAECSHGHAVRAGKHLHACGGGEDAVAVAHPHLCARVDLRKKGLVHEDVVQQGAAIFARGAAAHLAAGALGQQLGPVAHAQHGHLALQAAQVGIGGALVKHGGGASAKDDPLHRRIARELRGGMEGVYFAVHVQLAHTPGKQLRVLGAVVEDEDLGMQRAQDWEAKGIPAAGTAPGHGHRALSLRLAAHSHTGLNHGSTRIKGKGFIPVYRQAIRIHPRPSAVVDKSVYCAQRALQTR